MAKNYQDIYNSVYVTGNKMDWTNAMIRGNGIPLDIYSVFDEYNEAVKFAATNAVAYEGQVLAVTENGDTTVYVITPAKQGTVVIDEVETDIYLKEVGSATLGDNKAIVLTDGVLSLKNFGVEYYAYDSEKKAWDEETTKGWIEGLQPKVINVGTTDEPAYEIAWFEPSSTTVEGLSETIGTLTERVATAEGTIKTQSTSISDNATAIAGLEEDKADKATTLEGYGITDAYTTEEVDSAISEAVKLKKDKDFIIHPVLSVDEETGQVTIVSVDKTYSEILEAYEAGRDVILLFGEEYMIPLTEIGAKLTFSTITPVGVIQMIVDQQNVWTFDHTVIYNASEIDEFLNNKADKATTLEGYGITDAYTKTETDTAISDAISTDVTPILNNKADKATTLGGYGITDAYTKEEVDGKISGAFHFRGSVDYQDQLPTDASEGDVYVVKYMGSSTNAGTNAYNAEFAWNGTNWVEFGSVIDMSGYATKSDIQDISDEIEAINNESTGILATAKGYTDAEVAKNKALIDANAEAINENLVAIEAINNESTGILATAKGYTDAEVAKNKALIDTNAEAINENLVAIEAINNESTGILATAKGYTDAEVAKNKELIDANADEVADEIADLKTADTENLATAKGYTDTEVAKNKALIDAINDESTGILVTAKGYTDTEVAKNKTLIDAINNETTGILTTAKGYTDAREIEINKNVSKNAEDIAKITDADTGVLKQAKDYADGLNTAMDGRVTANTSAIDAINNGDTGILVTAKGYTDTEVAKNKALIDQNILDIKSNKDAIDAINNGDTGILVTAKGYTDTEVAKNKALIDAINNESTGILTTAKGYTDTEVAKNKALIDAINNETTGILATAKRYTDAREVEINKNVSKNAEDIAKITDANTGILKQAKDYADDQIVTKIASSNCMVYRGTVGEGGTVAELPTSNVKNGDTYKVLTDGTYEGQQAFTGDMFIAVVTTTDDTATIAWTLIPSGDDGNINASVDTILTDGALVIGKGNKEVGILANGTEGQIVRIGTDGKPYYEDELTYEITSSNDSISVTDNSEGREGSFDITVKSVSTDILVQGNNILILDGGNSNGSYSVTI
jgi:hypothetical protein